MSGFCPIKTGRLAIWPPTPSLPDDVLEKHVAWLNDKTLMRWSEQRHEAHTLDSQKLFLIQAHLYGPLVFAVFLKDGTAIGTVHAHLAIRHQRADMGIMLGPTFHGHGYAGEAWEAVEQWLYKERGIRKFEAGCVDANEPMICLLERLRYFLEGRRTDHFVIDGENYDLVQYGKLIL